MKNKHLKKNCDFFIFCIVFLDFYVLFSGKLYKNLWYPHYNMDFKDGVWWRCLVIFSILFSTFLNIVVTFHIFSKISFIDQQSPLGLFSWHCFCQQYNTKCWKITQNTQKILQKRRKSPQKKIILNILNFHITVWITDDHPHSWLMFCKL